MSNPHKFWRLTLDTNPEDCNLHCIMCEEHSPYSDFIPRMTAATGIKRRRMPYAWVERLIGEAAALGATEIIPSTMGEPLLYKGFERLFEAAGKAGIKINLTTNGTFPKKSVEEWAEVIVPHTSDVKISWNGATAETASKVMLGIDFEEALDNVKRFIAVRDRIYHNGGNFCRVTFQLTFMDNNMHELADMVKLAAQLGVNRVKGHHLWDHFSEIKHLNLRNDPARLARWNRYVEEAQKAANDHLLPNGEPITLENIHPLAITDASTVPQHYECPFLGKELWISATGKISPCCAPDEQRQALGDFGNIEDVTLEGVLNSEPYQALVHHYREKPLCQGCTMRIPPSTNLQ